MASGPKMMAPICLVENHKEQLSVNQKALEILDKISQPVVVVAIVGLYRTGKSYLMNRLAGQNHGFPLGSTVQSETKGIWMWCVPHPTKPKHTLVLLDTEGLGDVEKVEPTNDSWIFALAVLLSSTFVYNSMGTINHQALEQLHVSYVTELTELIRAKSSPSPDGIKNSTEFVSFFPDFIWTVRDFTLELKLDGKSVTEDEYLENALKLIPGDNPRIQASNLPRECIRHFFPKRKCFVFDRPTNDKELLRKIETISEDQLDPKFQEQTRAFVSYIFTEAKIKTLREGIKASEVFQTFLKSQATIESSIMQADTALTAGEKAIAEERAQREAAEKEQDLLRQKQEEQQQLMEAQERSHKENLEQLRTKLVQEREQLIKDQKKMLEKQLQILLGWQVAMIGSQMMAPICLVENQKDRLSVNPKAIEILNKISQPVVVVAIAGLYRFPLGSTVQSETKGIWMWCVPHPTKPKHTLVLLDTEGLGDVEKVDPTNDSWIFALAVLLSSTFVYNSMGTINHQALEQLHASYVTELTELIRKKSSPSPNGIKNSTEFVSFFPDFIWTVRDFTLELKIDGKSITEEEYLENALKLIPGDNPRIQASNLPRECIRHFFPKRKCFVFDRPTNDKELLCKIETISEDQLDPKFQEQMRAFVSYIFTEAKIKTLREGIKVTGNRLGTLVTTYVDAINSGAVPCLDDAVTALAQHENSAAVQKAAEHYSEQMGQQLRLPTDTLQELLDVHTACEKEATAVFMEHSFKDENQQFQKKLLELIDEKKSKFISKNEEASDQYCQEELNRLSKAFIENISKFFVPGGHRLYMQMRKKIEDDYWQVPRKGEKASEVFQRFLKSQATIESSILQADTALTDKEKAIAEERAQKEAAEKEQALLRQKQKEQQQLMEAQERSHKENLEQLRMKLVQERDQLIRDQEKMLEKQLQDQKALLEEGFKKKSEEMSGELEQLKSNLKDMKENSGSILENILKEFAKAICGPLFLIMDIINGLTSSFK
ncbi:Guanylate-binding protein 6 [Microtus ochrogaster]|uniref:Guanylate-binding protein 6 n=1 Tax=Microtus ochrogaster TaxID=79684 RepID=A0A8J6GR25_MICOH|nr:Guanylate-binding protein 6 [Microtus ochrogaster]